MASNPMKRKSRISFLLGMIVALIIASGVIFLMWKQLDNKNKELEAKEALFDQKERYILKQDIKSGQVVTADMFKKEKVSKNSVPTNSTDRIADVLANYALTTSNGINIYYNSQDEVYYYIMGNNQRKCPLYINENGEEKYADKSYLVAGSKAYYYAGDNNEGKTDITIAENAVVAKIDLGANTVMATDYITRSSEKITDEIRKSEYNVISLPTDLVEGDYIDVRFVLPNGEDLIVVSKKQVSIPMAGESYIEDTIQMNLSEEEILLLSCAIVENYKMEGSKIYATRYTDAGLQKQAKATYFPNEDVRDLVTKDPNIATILMGKLSDERRQAIQKQVDSGKDEIDAKVKQSITSSQESRKTYLQSLTGTKK